jgi:uncharacterized protein YraI
MKTFINLFFLLVSSNFSLAGTGFIEISGDPGFSVVLGDEPKGVLGETPLMLSGINVGRHNLAFLKQGYQRVDHVVEVSANSVTQISMTASDPGVSFGESPSTELLSQRKVGWMDITTWPTHCKLEIVGEHWASSDLVKVASTHRASNLPEGVYKIMATAKGIKAQGELEVVDGKQSACFMNLEESKFIDLVKEMTKAEQAERMAESKAEQAERMAERAVDAANKATEERLATEKAALSSKEENEMLLQEFERLKAKVETASQVGESKERNEEFSRLLQEFERLKARVENVSREGESKKRNEGLSRNDPISPTTSPPASFVTGVPSGDTLSVRSGPGTKYRKVSGILNGVRVFVIGEPIINGGTEWVPIKFENSSGWVTTKYLRASERMMFIDGESNFRTGPGTETEVLYQPANGSPGTVIKREGSWIQIRLDNGDVGWAHERNLKPLPSGAPK